MKQLKLNLYWGDTVSVGPPPSHSTDFRGTTISLRNIKSTDYVAKVYPEPLYVGGYPPSTTKREVPFEHNDKTVVSKRPQWFLSGVVAS